MIAHPLQLLLLPQTTQKGLSEVVDMGLELNDRAVTLCCGLLRSQLDDSIGFETGHIDFDCSVYGHIRSRGVPWC